MKTFPLVFLLILLFFLSNFAWSQVKIGDNINTIDQSSIVELESNSKVFVVTRVSTIQMNAITPLNGALVYNTDDHCLFQFRNDAWVSLCVDIVGGQTVTTITENNDGTFTYNNEAGTSVSITKASLNDNNDGTYTFDNGSLPPIILDTNANSNPYNNVLSSLAANNVQAAIDELNTALNAANTADLDTDATNELSDLELTNTTLSLTNPEAGATGVDLDTTFATDAELLAATDDDITGVTFDGTDLTVDEGATTFSADLSALEESADIIAVQNDVDTNETAANTAIALKEDAANKSTDITLADATDTKFPTELAVKTYVDGQIAATADDDITGVTFDGTDLTVEEDATSFSANLSALEESADIIIVQNDVDANETAANTAIANEEIRALAAELVIQNDVDANEAAANTAIALKEDAANKSTDITLADATDTKFPTELAVKTYVDGQIAATADDDITGVTFDGTDLTVEEDATSFSANLSALEESADIIIVQNDVDANETAANTAIANEEIRALAAELVIQNDVDANEVAANTAIALKEDAANKSTDITLADATDTKFPTELAVKTYVDGQIAATADDDITGVTFDGTDLTVEEDATSFSANLSALEESADIIAVQNDVDANETAANTAIALKEDTANKSTDGTLAGNSNVNFPTEQAVKTYVDALAVTDLIAGNKIATITEADGTILEIDETITSLASPTGAESTLVYTNEANGITTIPNIVRSVNGVNPAANGNVAVVLSSVSTGLESDLPLSGIDADVYIVSGEVAPNSDRNGVAFIYDDPTGWQEVTTDLATADARYVNSIGDAMTGPLSMGNNSITAVNDPVNLQDAATKNYVDSQVATITTDDDISAVDFDGTNLSVTESGTTLSANLSALEESADITANTALINTNITNIASNDTDITDLQNDKEDTVNKSTDGTLADNSNIDFPTEQAVKTYVDAQVGSITTDDDISAVDFDGTNLSVTESGTTLSANLSALEESADITANTALINTNITNITSNDTDITDLQNDKEDTTNKSSDVTLADATNTLYPTELAVKTYVDAQITATADDDITGVTFDGTNLTVEEDATSFSANLSALEESADIIIVQNDVDANEVAANTAIANEEIRALAAELVIQNDVDANETAANTAIALKEDAANKSTDITLADATDTKFPTELAVKTYVDAQITATADDDISAVNFDGTNLSVTESGTTLSTNLSALEESADIVANTTLINTNITNITSNDTDITDLQNDKEDAANKSTDITLADATNTKFPTELAVKTYVDGQIAATGDGNVTSSSLTVGGDTNALLGDVTLEITPGANDQVLTTDNLGALAWVNSTTLNHTGTTGSLFFAGAAGDPDENNSQLFWDSVNNRLGIGTNTPTHKLQVGGQVRATSFANANGTSGAPSYRFNSDSNTGMYRAAADQLAFSTAGTEAFRIDATGKMGIGTPTPDESLHIANNMRLDGSFEDKDGDAGTVGQILTSTATGTDWTDVASTPIETITTLAQNTTTGVITYTNETPTAQTANTVGAETNNSITVGANGGAFYESPIKAFGKISGAGTVTRSTTGVTVAKLAGNGHYRVTLPAGVTTDANYIIQLTQPGRGGAGNDDPGISYNNQTASTFEVIIGDNDNGGTDRARFDSEFMFTILDL